MQTCRPFFLVLVLCIATKVVSEERPVAAPYRPFAFLVGHTWEGTFPDGKTIDRHTYEWVYGGKFIRDTHVVTSSGGKYEGETIFAWNSNNKQVVFWYIANNGTYSQGTVDVDGETFTVDEQHQGRETQVLKTKWEKVSDSEYRVETYREKDKQQQLLFAVTYKKQTTPSQ